MEMQQDTGTSALLAWDLVSCIVDDLSNGRDVDFEYSSDLGCGHVERNQATYLTFAARELRCLNHEEPIDSRSIRPASSDAFLGSIPCSWR